VVQDLIRHIILKKQQISILLVLRHGKLVMDRGHLLLRAWQLLLRQVGLIFHLAQLLHLAEVWAWVTRNQYQDLQSWVEWNLVAVLLRAAK